MREGERFERDATAGAIALPELASPLYRSLLDRLVWRLRGGFDRVIGASSLVPNDPVLDVRAFNWTQALRDNWEAIRDEAARVRGARVEIAMHEGGTGFPVTRSVVARIPDLDSAHFSILPPGTHVPAHRGVSKGLLTCHLGLVVPRDGDVRMRVEDRTLRWAEGEALVFDDTYDHELWNDAAGNRVLLSVRVRRPLRQPGRWIADAFLNIARRRSPARRTGAGTSYKAAQAIDA